MNNVNDNLEDIIFAINSIELPQEDLLQVVLNATKNFAIFNKDKIAFIDSLFNSSNFIHTCLETARESLLLGMQTIIMKDGFDFKTLVNNCYNKSARQKFISNASENEDTNIFLQMFFSEVAIEIFTASVSRNKGLISMSNIDNSIINRRVEIFKNYVRE